MYDLFKTGKNLISLRDNRCKRCILKKDRNSNWKKLLGFRNMSEKLEKIYFCFYMKLLSYNKAETFGEVILETMDFPKQWQNK